MHQKTTIPGESNNRFVGTLALRHDPGRDAIADAARSRCDLRTRLQMTPIAMYPYGVVPGAVGDDGIGG